MKVNVWDLLRKRFPESEYALMQEVSDSAGFNRSNSADYIAVNLWPSRGLSITGIEQKASRTDWLKELKNPAKAENILKNCHYFWLLTTDDTIARLEEIPQSWGWMNVKGSRIYTMKAAPMLTPIPVDMNFVAAMLKRACNKSQFIHISAIEERIAAAKMDGRDESKRLIDNLTYELAELKKQVHDFEQASGVKISEWRPISGFSKAEKVGQAVRFYLDGGADSFKKELTQLEQKAKTFVENIEKAKSIFESEDA